MPRSLNVNCDYLQCLSCSLLDGLPPSMWNCVLQSVQKKRVLYVPNNLHRVIIEVHKPSMYVTRCHLALPAQRLEFLVTSIEEVDYYPPINMLFMRLFFG